MESLNVGAIMNTILAGLGIALVMGAVGMALWYIKVKPNVDDIKNDLAKKAASAEVVRINLELEQKRTEAERIKRDIDEKQNRSDCDLLRKGCQPLLLEKINGLTEKVESLVDGQLHISNKLERWMEKNGK